MKKLLYLVCFVFSLLSRTLILPGCQEKVEVIDGMYQKDGFYFPIETQGCEVESISLFLSPYSKMYGTEDEAEIKELLNLLCAKKLEYVGTMNYEEFKDFYFIDQGA